MKVFNGKIFKIYTSILAIFVLYCTIILFTQNGMLMVYALESSENIIGDYYEFDEKSDYEFSSADSSTNAIAGKNTFGTFSLSGNFTETEDTKGIPTYSIRDGNLKISYTFDQALLNVEETEWHLIEDKSKKVDILTLDKKIMFGALILQSSLDGKNWIEDVIKTDIFTEDTDLDEVFYTTKNIQQQNGCYYRVVVVYEIEIKTGSHKVAFINIDDTSSKKVAEVYKFYVVNRDVSSSTSASSTPRKELGKKVNTGKDNGYFGSSSVDKDDPHYGWDLGTLFVNGYTREIKDDDGASVFLKNVGDKVTLWFNLKQDINNLNGNSDLTIAEDKNGYDKAFEVAQTNFGHGTLIIKYTDYEGVVHDPVIYTDYLAANARTGADTRVQLFEEGDYEVTLDYEIKNNPRQLGLISVLPTFTDYKILITFSIRNGNSMVYPFDTNTGRELSDNSITKNGFKLDMAKSRYLTIDVIKSVLKVGIDGSLTEDVRFNRPAKDGEAYTNDGIYTFSVKNLYSDGEPTKKTIYVGVNKYLLALSKFGLSVTELNEMITLGAEVSDDGTVVEAVEETINTIEEESSDIEELVTEIANQPEKIAVVTEGLTSKDEGAENEILVTSPNTSSILIPVIGIIAALSGVLVFAFIKQKFGRKSSGKDGSK